MLKRLHSALKNKTLLLILTIVALAAALFLAVSSAFLPAQVNNLTSQIVGPAESMGNNLTADFVEKQAWVFWWVLAFVTLVIGAFGFLFIRLWMDVYEARVVVSGKTFPVWNIFLYIVYGILCFTTLAFLPRVVFFPLDSVTLQRIAPVAHFFQSSVLGNLLLGLLGAIVSLGIYLLIFRFGWHHGLQKVRKDGYRQMVDKVKVKA